METTQFIRTETLNLAEMQVRELIQTPIEARFDRIVRVTRRLFDSAVAAISLLDGEGEWFKSVTGWNVSRLPGPQSLTALLVHGEGPVVVPDLRMDERTREHPLVMGPPGFRFCAMQALTDRFGHRIGAVAVYDTAPRNVNADLLEGIADAGELAQRELLLSDMSGIQQRLLEKLDTSRRQALLDELTRLWNRRGGMMLLEQALAGAGRHDGSVGVCAIDVDDFKLINDQHGHAAGDEVLRELATVIVSSIRPGDVACRLGGDEFLLVITDTTAERLSIVAERLRNAVQSRILRTQAGRLRVTVSVGTALARRSNPGSADELVQRADEAMYEAKRTRDKRPSQLRQA